MVENDFENEIDNRVLEEQYLKNEEGKKLMTGYKKVEILDRSSHGKDSPFTEPKRYVVRRLDIHDFCRNILYPVHDYFANEIFFLL